MSWYQRYRLREFLHSSFWLYPSLAIVLAWIVGKLILAFVPDPGWPRFELADLDGLRTSMAALAWPLEGPLFGRMPGRRTRGRHSRRLQR